MEWIHLKCCYEEIKSFKKNNISSQVIEFDAWEDYDLINEFFGEHDKSWMCSREEYFEGDWYNKATWTDYVIMERGKIIARAAIYKNHEDSWEVAGVFTLPTYRQKGYGEAVVRYCTEKIIESNKIATLVTRESNIAMINTAKKVGFKIED